MKYERDFITPLINESISGYGRVILDGNSVPFVLCLTFNRNRGKAR
jgi:hypothetical protein